MITAKSLVPVLALGALALGTAANAQTYTFTTTNTSSGTPQTTGNNTLAGQTGDTGLLFFTNTPDFTSTNLSGVPSDNIVPFTVRANSNVTPGSTTSATTSINDTFNLSINLTSNGQTGVFTFTGLNLTGNMIYNGMNQSFNNGAIFTIPVFDTVFQTQSVGGSVFAVRLVSATNPGNPVGANPTGTIGGEVVNTSLSPVVTPEPGSMAMLVGMGVTGAGFLIRRKRSK